MNALLENTAEALCALEDYDVLFGNTVVLGGESGCHTGRTAAYYDKVKI